jgi:hypothetical protein
VGLGVAALTLLWAALSPVVIRLVHQFPIETRPGPRVAIHLIASVLFSLVRLLIHFSLVWLLTEPISMFLLGLRRLTEPALYNFPFGVVAYWVVVAIVYAASYL